MSVNVEPMTDLARLVTGPNGSANLQRLMSALEGERAKAKATMNAGGSVSKMDHDIAMLKERALMNAQSVLKSVEIFHGD